ncbi:MAG: glycosyltransferase family 4 protein [Candidatus Woesearchaeota archaeon]|nr:MAG: glycosyltransferase family 4 protein [Candidatus Woesearchaeota archaeon]
MKKLLYVHNADYRGLAANKVQVLNMCAAFAKTGVEVSLLSFYCDATELKKTFGITPSFALHSLTSNASYGMRSIRLYREIKKSFRNVEVVYTRDLLVAFLASKLLSCPVIYELHELPASKIWWRLFAATYHSLKNCVVISEGLAVALEAKGFAPEKLVVLHDGVFLEDFAIKDSVVAARKALGLPKTKKIVMYVGSLKGWKGHDTFIEAAQHLSTKDVLFVSVGGRRDEVSDLRKKYPRLTFFSRQEHTKIPLFLRAADVLIIPNTAKENISALYTSPLKLFEYMAAQKPIVVSDLPSMRAIVSEKEVVFAKPDDARSFAKAIDMVLGSDAKQKTLAKNAFALAHEFSWEKRAQAIRELFIQ